jgi:hypothetical protein
MTSGKFGLGNMCQFEILDQAFTLNRKLRGLWQYFVKFLNIINDFG